MLHIIYTYICIYIYIHMYMCVYIYICICVYIYIYICTYIYIYIHMYAHIHLYIHMFVYYLYTSTWRKLIPLLRQRRQVHHPTLILALQETEAGFQPIGGVGRGRKAQTLARKNRRTNITPITMVYRWYIYRFYSYRWYIYRTNIWNTVNEQ